MSWRRTGVALVIAVLAAGLNPATATSPGYPDSGMGPGRTQLVSVGSTPIGGSSRADSPAVSDSGRFIAYTQKRQENYYDPATSEVWRRDIVAGTSTRVSGVDAAAAPSISGNGRLMAYVESQDDTDDVFTADLSDPGKPVRHRVTGLATDVPFQRTEHCTAALGSPEAAPKGCGPVLSGDGRSLAIPADRSVVSPQLALDVVDDDSPYPPGYVDGLALVDFAAVPTEDPDAPRDLLLGIQVAGPHSVRIGTPTVTEGPFTTYSPGADCTGQVVEPGRACYLGVRFVPSQAACGTAYGMLRVPSPTPEGQVMVPLVGERLCPTPVPAAAAARAGASCPEPETAEPSGSPRQDPGTRDTPVFVGEAAVGSSDFLLQEVALGEEDGPLEVKFSSSDCALELTPPPGAEDTPDYARSDCYDGGSLDDGKTNCVAHVRFRPQSVRASVATLQLVDPDDGTINRTFRFIAGGRDSVVVIRRDPSGTGRFSGPGTPPARIVSVDADGEVMSGTAPTLSGNGRYVAFVSGVTDTDDPGRKAQVFVHDTDAAADGSWVSGDTANASLVEDPAQGHDRYAEYAVQPSLSGDGSRLAFVDLDREQSNSEDADWVTTRSEVHVRDLAREITRRVSVSTMSDQPSLGRDGRTVAFASVVQVEEEDQTQIFVTDLPADLAGIGEPRVDPVSLREDGTSVRSAESPAVSADGGIVAFVSADHLTDEQGECCEDERNVFARTRYPGPTVSPSGLTFAPQQVGTTGLAQPVSISNAGPGPLRITTRITEGFVVTGGCAATVHRDESCRLLVAARPRVAGAVSGELTIRLGATNWAGEVIRVALSGSGVAPRFLLTPKTVRFGDQGLGTSSDPVVVRAVNVGDQPVELSAAVVAMPATTPGPAGPASPVDFQVTGPAGSQDGCRRVAPRAACAFQVRFRPAALGPRTGQLVVTLTLGDLLLVQLVDLAGNTAQPELELSPSVAREGRVVFVTGSNFLPGVPLKFGWSGGPVVVPSVVPDATGTFTMPIVILPGRTGTQTVTLTMPGIGTITAPDLVVAPGSLQPPSFVSRN